MKYLITGASGFIGPYLVRKLTSQGECCRCLVRSDSDLSQLRHYRNISFVYGDITKPDTLNGITESVDYLIHMATLGHMNNYKVSEEMFEAVNVQGTLNIMREAQRGGVKKIIHCSSVAAMGICSDIPADEKSACRPHNPYGKSKLKAEQKVLKMIQDEALPAVIIRFSMVYGPGDKRDILRLTRMAKKGLFPKVGNRQKLTPLIHVEDAVDGLLSALEKGKIGEIYLITNQQSEPFDNIRLIIQRNLGVLRIPLFIPEWLALSAALFIETIFKLIGKAPPVTRKNIESTLKDRVFSIKKAQQELGFNPSIDPEEGLKETIKWYMEKKWV